jgi:hypothetical protein
MSRKDLPESASPSEKRRWPDRFWTHLASLAPLPEDFVAPAPLPPSPHRDEILGELGAE